MPSEKRERQRANRASKAAEHAKVERRQALIKRGKQLALLVVVVLLFALILSFFTDDATPETEAAPIPAVMVIV
ncbi:MAG: hypothetical protein HKN93_05235 [Acidimicrobiia bacterium]|nr:hypothetical protein [Acidimicrobiia bacterium]